MPSEDWARMQWSVRAALCVLVLARLGEPLRVLLGPPQLEAPLAEQ